jgi:thiol:disulfide interchange protein DsbA
MIRSVVLALCLILSLVQSQARAASEFTPRPGTDYVVLPAPHENFRKGRIEVAEVFSYRCIHCAHFQPLVNEWRKSTPKGVRWEYVPAVWGGSWDAFARAYFAAEILEVRQKTHDAVFKAVFVDEVIKTGTLDEIADMYASFGVDRAAFVATMESAAVDEKLERARDFEGRTGVNATPTIILNGKYRIVVTPDRGFEGMLATLSFLLAHERM